ncbi:MAG TPA: fused MFS/spermidine synthase [Gemmatimonadaceae bacterium]|nr:fused MFS/spermidine synthase [Gemmatimonadaceae bacterium]
MAKQIARQAQTQTIALPLPPTQRFLPLLLLLFVGSGCAALIYEIVWFQLIELVIGSSAVSLGVLLGTFMGGMCLGSLLLPRFVSPEQHPLRVYAALEAGIGILGLIVLVAVPLVGGVYTATAMGGLAGILWRGLLCAICLLPPTLLMGATLPAIARWVETTPTGVSWLGFFYGSNIAGAVFGCLLAGFYLLRVHDMTTTTVVAVGVNFLVAGVGLALSKRAPHRPAVQAEGANDVPAVPRMNVVYAAIGLSGMSALGAEVVWTRLLSLMLGASVYTFSIILAVFLVGLGFGSSGGAALSRGKSPRAALGWCQLLLTVAIAWSAFMMAKALPYWPINPSLSPSPWITFQVDFLRSLVAVFPAALLWGASFPLAIAAVVGPGQDAGRLVGRVYAANTVGAIIGSVIFSIVVIPQFGTQRAEVLLIAISLVSALVVFASMLRKAPTDLPLRRDARPIESLGRVGMITVVAASIVAVVLAANVPGVPDGLVAYGRFLPTYTTEPKYLYVGEGMNSSIAVSEEESGARNFHVAGKVEASSLPQDMRLQRMLGHISALLVNEPKSVLVVGFGAGVTAGSFVTYPGIKRIVICEIEPLIPKVVSTYFTAQNYNVAHDPRVEIVYDDARHFILTTKEKFDVITSDPIHPWVKGAATLYTKEYFELVKQHLNPGGVVTQWVPLYESFPEVVKSELATFFNVFPDGTVWSNDINGKGYDVLLAGHATPQPINLDSIAARLNRPENARVVQSLNDVGFNSPLALFTTYGGQARDLAPWLVDAQINRDVNLRLQYLAGMGLNTYENATIYDEMLHYRRYPENLFTGSDDARNYLRGQIGGGAP